MTLRMKIVAVALCLASPGCISISDDTDDQAEDESTGDGDGDGDEGPGPLDGPFDAPNGPFCGLFHFEENLGPDYASALAALGTEVAMTYDSYFLEEELIEGPVYDYYDNVVERDFWVISILDSEGGAQLQGVNDILDDEGNHYWIDWCPD
jgi:hypothetical protein